VPRPVPLLALIAALALASCGDGDDPVAVDEGEACKAVRERLTLDEIEDRFGEPDSSQDFFGDRVVAYDDGEEEGVRWQFQVSAQAGTFRALRVEGQREEIVECPS
jgi:hypothetical protein